MSEIATVAWLALVLGYGICIGLAISLDREFQREVRAQDLMLRYQAKLREVGLNPCSCCFGKGKRTAHGQ